MAFPTPSGCFVVTFTDIFDATQLAVDLDSETLFKVALFQNGMAATSLITDVGYGTAPWNTTAGNEVAAGGGYTQGGIALTGTTFVHQSAGLVAWDATDPSWPTATITARGALYYCTTPLAGQGLVAQNFGADIVSTGGTFLIQLALPSAGAIFGIDFVP